MRTAPVLSRLTVDGLLIFACLFAVSLLASTQEPSPAPPKTEQWNYGEMRKVPEKARLKLNPLEKDPEAIHAGGKLFDRHCAECHGMKAEGGRRAPSLLHEEVQQATPGDLFWVISNGVIWHGMPDWSNLPEPQRWQIVAFLKSFNTQALPVEPNTK